ncbi:MAG: Tn3 family transposase [Maricaulaceae bacterium]
MTFNDSGDDVTDGWTISFDESRFLSEKKRDTQLDYAYQIKFYQRMGRFPKRQDAISTKALNYLKDQLKVSGSELLEVSGRTERRRRIEISEYLTLKPLGEEDEGRLENWLHANTSLLKLSAEELKTAIRVKVFKLGNLPLTERELERQCNAFRAKHDNAEYVNIYARLNERSHEQLLKSLAGKDLQPSLADIRKHNDKPNHKTFDETVRLVSFIQDLDLPRKYLESLDEEWSTEIRKRIRQQEPWEIRRHHDEKQIGMYAIYLCRREEELTDGLIDTLVNLIQGQQRRARNAFQTSVSKNSNKLINREKLLMDILAASLENPQGSVEDVIFGIVSKTDAQSLIKTQTLLETKKKSTFLHMHKRWKTTYRRLLKVLLNTIEFESHNAECLPLLRALDWIHLNFNQRKIIIGQDDIPINGVISKSLLSSVADQNGVVDRYSYELSVVTSLRDRLRSRSIWVKVSRKYRNPDEDTPEDFAENVGKYCEVLDVSDDPRGMIENLKFEMEYQLLGLNAEITKNPHVSVDWGPERRFKIKKLPRLVEPKNLAAIKRQIYYQWPMISLMDMLKETALDTNFLKVFKTIGEYQNLDPSRTRERQLLCLYALGSNTGIKRTSAAVNNASYEQLLHVNRRFIDAESVREANRIVINSILSTRDPDIWGHSNTTCASDSKQFQAWDKNPRAEQHLRYGDSGLMIYWHVENGSVCLYSQAKKVSTPEPASMITGFLNHASNMKISRQFVDSHGQTEIAFAFCYLLGFDLAPRIKNIANFKLYLPEGGILSALDEIGCLTHRPINWELIRQQYSEMIKYAVAMKLGKSDPDTILRRFYRSDVMHPTHKGLAELGRAIKTIFACRYLRSLKFRQEIQKGLNVMENWNSATNFIFFGKSGEISTNTEEGQDLSVQALHLLQNSLIYVNTHMYQSVLSKPEWRDKMTPDDFRGITPLIYEHVNPYGKIELDLAKRVQYAG